MQGDSFKPGEGDTGSVAPMNPGSDWDAQRNRPPREARDARETLRDSLLVTHVDGMHSHRCEDTIIRAISALPGVREAEVDFASGQASVIFDARKISSHQLIAAIEQAGYRCPDAHAMETKPE